jgi:hypothetical protein
MTGIRTKLGRAALVVATGLTTAALPRVTHAQVFWTDWTSLSVGTTGSAAGTITTSAGPVGVTYSGQVYTTSQTGCGAAYWATNPAIYRDPPDVPNGPADAVPGLTAGLPCDIVSLTGGPTFGTNTVTFSQPILDPLMTILSLGQPGVTITYNFDQPFNILNTGSGYFGGSSGGSLFQITPNVLTGTEGHGLIQFTGTFSSISWTVPNAETWHGFTLGIVGRAPPTSIPEPTTTALLAIGLVGLVARGVARRRGRA